MARVTAALAWLLLCAGCWRDPDAVAARFAAAADVGGADVAAACPEGSACDDDAPCLVAPHCVSGHCTGPERYWARTVQVSGDRDEIDAVWPTADGGLLAVGSAQVSTAPYGLARHLFALHLGPDGLGPDGQPPVPLWLKQDAAHDHVLTGIVPLPDGHFLGVGRHVEVPGPLGTAPRMWAWWMRFDPVAGALFDTKLEVDGAHAWNAVAQSADGASLAVGVLDQAGLLTRFTPQGERGWARTLLPPSATRGRLQAVAGLPGSPEAWVAAGYRVSDAGRADGGWVVALAGPATATTWTQTYAPPDAGNAAFYWVGAVGDEILAVGALWPADGGEFPADGVAKTWFVRIDRSDGHRIAERTWALPGNPGAFSVLGPDRLAVWQHGAPGSQDGSLVWLDPLGNPLGESPLPRHAITALTGYSDGSLSLTGVTRVGAGDAYLAHVSPWGAATCTDAGPCAGTSLATCDDHAPCTADRCDPVLACIHTPLPDASPCATGTCLTGACTP